MPKGRIPVRRPPAWLGDVPPPPPGKGKTPTPEQGGIGVSPYGPPKPAWLGTQTPTDFYQKPQKLFQAIPTDFYQRQQNLPTLAWLTKPLYGPTPTGVTPVSFSPITVRPQGVYGGSNSAMDATWRNYWNALATGLDSYMQVFGDQPTQKHQKTYAEMSWEERAALRRKRNEK